MELLLDTHALVWWWTDDARLPAAARAAIAAPDHTVLVSAASGWELSTRHRLGKWPEVQRLLADFDGSLRRSRFGVLEMSLAHARLASALERPHRDPFDRMLIAQCRIEAVPVVSGDAIFGHYGVQVVWR